MDAPKVFILDQNFNVQGILDDFRSFIWITRYREVGECDIEVNATTDNLNLFREKWYIYNTASPDMLCRIEKIRINTSIESGNTLIISGVDMKKLLDQRVVWETATADRYNAELFAREKLVAPALGASATDENRKIKVNGSVVFGFLQPVPLQGIISEQVSYKNIGEKIREYCQRFDWGYKVMYIHNAVDGLFLKFGFYKGADRSGSVVFSPNFDNLIESSYEKDMTDFVNIALVAGEGEGSNRRRAVSGNTSNSSVAPKGVDRYEMYVDARQISKSITYGDLIQAFPGGSSFQPGGTGSPWYYRVPQLVVPVANADHRAWLRQNYPDGTFSDGTYTIDTDQGEPGVIIAALPSQNPGASDTVVMYDVIYLPNLYAQGDEKLSEHGITTTFNGTIEPNVTFMYGVDYQLGDLVMVKNEFGISQAARIMEVVEAWDDQGYHAEPEFEYIEQASLS
jgi:hypothetical protein